MRAKYAPVAPIQLLKELEDLQLLWDYNLLLAHDVLTFPEGYHQLFHKRPGIVILDNSTIETGTPLERHQLEEAAVIVDNPTICLPDMVQDKDETLKRINDFLDRGEVPYEVMAIPQGETQEEVIECAEEIILLFGDGYRPEWWGVPRWIANEFGSRAYTVRELWKRHPVHIHLLGCSRNLHDDIKCARMTGAIGIDSANLINLGQLGKVLFRDDYGHPPREQIISYHGLRGEIRYDYWQETALTPEAVMNIVKFRSVLV